MRGERGMRVEVRGERQTKRNINDILQVNGTRVNESHQKSTRVKERRVVRCQLRMHNSTVRCKI